MEQFKFKKFIKSLNLLIFCISDIMAKHPRNRFDPFDTDRYKVPPAIPGLLCKWPER
jgi:hypothetical protein